MPVFSGTFADRTSDLVLGATNDVAIPSREWRAQRDMRVIVSDVTEGTPAMRRAGKRYLPQEKGEFNSEYQDRLIRSTFFNGYKKTINSLTGKPFSRPISFKDDPPELEEWQNDIDLEGNSIDVFAKNTFFWALADGIRFILVDFPTIKRGLEDPSLRARQAAEQPPVNRPPTLFEEREMNIRPYMVDIDSRDIIGWKWQTIQGRQVVTQVRILERATRPDPKNRFEDELVERIRVLERGSFEIWERQENEGDFEIVDRGLMAIDVIPLVPVYTNRTGFFMGKPRLSDLLFMNIQHWQKDSDQSNLVHIAHVPILYGAGFKKGSGDLDEIGGKRSIVNENPDAKLSFTEHSGAAIGAGKEDIEMLENRMRIEGMEMIAKKISVTATEKSIDAREHQSDLASLVSDYEDALQTARRLMLRWGKKDPNSAGELEMFKDFSVGDRDIAELQTLLASRVAGEISQERYLMELQRRGVLSDSMDIDEEIERTQQDAVPTIPFQSADVG